MHNLTLGSGRRKGTVLPLNYWRLTTDTENEVRMMLLLLLITAQLPHINKVPWNSVFQAGSHHSAAYQKIYPTTTSQWNVFLILTSVIQLLNCPVLHL